MLNLFLSDKHKDQGIARLYKATKVIDYICMILALGGILVMTSEVFIDYN
jgi:hypothetical protein